MPAKASGEIKTRTSTKRRRTEISTLSSARHSMIWRRNTMLFFQAGSSAKFPKAGKQLSLQGPNGARKKKCQFHPYQLLPFLPHAEKTA